MVRVAATGALPACVHVDLDGVRHVYRAHGWPEPDADHLFKTGMEAALEFFERESVRATLFAIAEDVLDPEKRPLLEEAVRAGHEIASHTWTHRKLRSVPAAERAREIADSRKLLEDELGTPVTGFRAPGFDVDADVLERIVAAGYGYDSSLFVAGANPLGAPAPAGPFPLRSGAATLELPLPPYRPLPLPWHPSYALVLGRAWFSLGLGTTARSSTPLVLLCHLTDFADPEPTARGLQRRLFTLSFLSRRTKLARMGGMLEQVRKRYEILPTGEFIEATRHGPG